jgi:hypothetical protein
MSKFQLFDAVNLTQEISLTDEGVAPPETAGAIVEVFNNAPLFKGGESTQSPPVLLEVLGKQSYTQNSSAF